LNGNGDVIGDGLVPRDSALLIGSKQVVMKETAHGKAFGKDWYGSKNKVEEWLNKSSEWNGNNSEEYKWFSLCKTWIKINTRRSYIH